MGLKPGDTLKRRQYTIERVLPPGRFALNYLTRNAEGQHWVIKVLDPQVLTHLDAVERDRQETLLWQEATKLAQCSDIPHIARVEMPFKEQGLICVPVEYLDGNSLAERSERTLTEETALTYIGQIGEALAIVHRYGLVHRDIRPANIFLRIRKGKPEAVLTNFELAVDCDTELTRTRTQELTDGFSPIELYSRKLHGRSKVVSPCTDVYSLAATLYELLTGETPVSAGDRGLHGHDLISPQKKNPDISGSTTRAIFAGMELLPEQRPQEIEPWLSKLKLSNGKSKHRHPNAVNWTKWQTIWGAVAAVIALAVGIPAWFQFQNSESTSSPSNRPVESSPK